MRPLLSICIPTFRRANIVYNAVLDHLSYREEEIEVVVSDNASPDNTIQLLNSISDTRLRIYENDINRGFQYNLNNAVRHAKGHYVCMMSDEDILRKDVLTEVLRWIKSNINDHYSIGAVIPGSNQAVFTRTDELMSILYGRCSYMSGIIINRDMLDEKDFDITYENFYQHIELALKCASKGRVILSPYEIFMPNISDTEENMVTRIKLQTVDKNEEKANCKKSPYAPEVRFSQLINEKNMILDLDVSYETKYILLERQFIVKTVQATIVYELLARSSKRLQGLGITEQHTSLGLEKEMGNTFIQSIKENLGEDYLSKAEMAKDQLLERIMVVRSNRQSFDELVVEQGYISFIAGKGNYIVESRKILDEFCFKIDYLCAYDAEIDDKLSIAIENMVEFSKVVILVDGDDPDFIEKLQHMKFREAHLIYIQDMYLSA